MPRLQYVLLIPFLLISAVVKSSCDIHFSSLESLSKELVSSQKQRELLFNYLESLSIDEFEEMIDQISDNLLIDFNDNESVGTVCSNADRLILAELFLPRKAGNLLSTLGFAIYEEIAIDFQQSVFEKRIESDNPISFLLQSRLAEHKIYKELPINNYSKLLQYLKDGRFEYIWQKFQTTYRNEFLMLLTILIVVLSMLLYFISRKNLIRKKFILNLDSLDVLVDQIHSPKFFDQLESLRTKEYQVLENRILKNISTDLNDLESLKEVVEKADYLLLVNKILSRKAGLLIGSLGREIFILLSIEQRRFQENLELDELLKDRVKTSTFSTHTNTFKSSKKLKRIKTYNMKNLRRIASLFCFFSLVISSLSAQEVIVIKNKTMRELASNISYKSNYIKKYNGNIKGGSFMVELFVSIKNGQDIYLKYNLLPPSEWVSQKTNAFPIENGQFEQYRNLEKGVNKIFEQIQNIELLTQSANNERRPMKTKNASPKFSEAIERNQKSNTPVIKNPNRSRYQPKADIASQGFRVDNIEFDNQSFSYVIFDPQSKKSRLSIVQDSVLGSSNTFKRLKQNTTQIMMNAGMYHINRTSVGLLIQDGKTLSPLNTKEGKGNFYMSENGVFLITDRNQVMVITTKEFRKKSNLKIAYATQSGPMLIIDGVINKLFGKESPNRHIRNGVGIMPDGKVVLIISEIPVRYYQLASLFKEKFNCANALYLDGAISKLYAPALNKNNAQGEFGPVIKIDAI